MIFLSLKTYKEATGDSVIKLLSSVKKVSLETGVPIIPVAQTVDLYRIRKELNLEIWAQHVDPIDPGRHMGFISPYSVKEFGASGVIINHAEHPVPEDVIKKTVEKSKEYGLKTLVLCQSIELAKQVEEWNPDYIGYEKGELIAGPVSMVEMEEKNIEYLAGALKKPLIVGAGIANGDHVKKAVKLGGKGVILASAFVKAENPEAKLRELAEGFKI
ncbi:triose-phosphate isomerase [Candidatus Roizmanbacteria bacterium]|nr:triose-phosphate isomerase [Candidatus Roizmanbacteria bacterium]